MGILSYKTDQTGLSGVTPGIIYIDSNDQAVDLEASGYLNPIKRDGVRLREGLMALVSYLDETENNVIGWYQVRQDGDNWNLAANKDNQAYPALVGTDWKYDTVQEAVDAGASIITVLENVSEVAPIAPDRAIEINIGPGITWTLGTQYIDVSAGSSVNINGYGDSTLAYGYSVAGTMVRNLAIGNYVGIKNLNIINTSTVAATQLTDNGRASYTNLDITLPNSNDGGIQLFTDDSLAIDIRFTGGGASCYNILDMDKGNADSISITGTFSTSSALIDVAAPCQLSQLSRATGEGDNWSVDNNGLINGVLGEVGCLIHMYANCAVNNMYEGVINWISGQNNCNLSNCSGITFFGNAVESSYNNITNLVMQNGFTVSGDNNNLSNISILNTNSSIVLSGSLNNLTCATIGTTPGGLGILSFPGPGSQNSVDQVSCEDVPNEATPGQNYFGLAKGCCNFKRGTLAPFA